MERLSGVGAKREPRRGSLLALQAPEAYVPMGQNTCDLMAGSWFALFSQLLPMPRHGVRMPLARSLLDGSSSVKLRSRISKRILKLI